MSSLHSRSELPATVVQLKVLGPTVVGEVEFRSRAVGLVLPEEANSERGEQLCLSSKAQIDQSFRHQQL